MLSPKDTIFILERLVPLGFTDEAFSLLHHFSDNKSSSSLNTIAAHKAYCETIKDFQSDGANEKVLRRLKLVLSAYLLGGFCSGHSDIFIALAEASRIEIPN